ncbi:response regulator [Agrobacterium larrymoorei]|uniref:response regulator n=1 Tax=Agrobacterium larrymoorei TaxID=160699 RepID=UPI0015723D46|nr:response regulator [Agrobacterium larrymoorei]NTJ43625.1 response regulator [Agrobacterium larrymoorei]
MAKILITEDEDALRTFVARALRLDGHETHEAADGEQGFEKLNEQEFDLLLSDIRMPVMDGIELAHRASTQFPGLKILLMTGYAEQRERADDLVAKIIDVVPKPFALPDIRLAVARALASVPA